MKIETTYSPGDSVFALNPSGFGAYLVTGPLTIGRVTVTVTDSPGREGEKVFDNYKPRKVRDEDYMCVETGIGTGQVYHQDDLLFTMGEALAVAKDRIKS